MRLTKYEQETHINYNEEEKTASVEIHKKWVKVRPPVKRTMTDEQRQKAAERLAKARKNQKC